MAAIRARLTPDQPREPSSPFGEPTWGVTQASVLSQGERRLEAEMYLSDGYGLRTAIEARSVGWQPLKELAKVWQPGRLKGIVGPPGSGVPLLAAGPVF